MTKELQKQLADLVELHINGEDTRRQFISDVSPWIDSNFISRQELVELFDGVQIEAVNPQIDGNEIRAELLQKLYDDHMKPKLLSLINPPISKE